MSEENNREKTFKVEDRRTLGDKPKGESEPERDGSPGDEGISEPSTPGPGTAGVGGSERMPKVDFSTFLFSLFSSALIQLGEMADPVSGKMEKNLDAAKQTIDIFDVIAEKTQGNLSDEEGKFLKNASAELKWKFLDAVKEKV